VICPKATRERPTRREKGYESKKKKTTGHKGGDVRLTVKGGWVNPNSVGPKGEKS